MGERRGQDNGPTQGDLTMEVYDRPPPYSATDFEKNSPPVPPRGAPEVPPRTHETSPPVPHRNYNVESSSGKTSLPTADPTMFFTGRSHLVPLPANVSRPTQTNKFYGNMLLGTQRQPVWTHPYSLWYTGDGLAFTHIREEQKVLGGPDVIPQYYFSPVGIRSFILGAMESSELNLQVGKTTHMSCEVTLSNGGPGYIRVPLVQGSGFITGIYNNFTPKLSTAVGFRQFNAVNWTNDLGIKKYQVILEDAVTWTIYLQSTEPTVDLIFSDANTIVANQAPANCTLQVVASTSGNIDQAAGCYPVGCNVTTNAVSSDSASYSLSYTTEGHSQSGKTLMYAMPHHLDYLDSTFVDSFSVNFPLVSTVCGTMEGFITNEFSMQQLPLVSKLSFEPFTTIPGLDQPNYKPDVLAKILAAARSEIASANVPEESNLDSMYFSGKALAKYAWMLYCCHFILGDESLTQQLLNSLKEAMNRFVTNQQKLPLIYDTTWKGIISSGDSSQDFGNSYYNDHHFHYSYHVIAAAIIVKVELSLNNNDSPWLAQNKDWVEFLIRDYANASADDPFFPQFRSFDWFNGHSWAKGLFESGDGKDEESSSEDVNASYALKLWGEVTKNSDLEFLGSIQLSILASSLNHYFLYSDGNTTLPKSFIPNKVSGILFENKIDHTTYFGNELQYIQMIHAIPITPASSFIRTPKFVREEWEEKLAPILNNVNDGWKGVMMLNMALFDPAGSYAFFLKRDLILAG
ncbi:endo-1,3(4)-beta-glucanase KNAG_0A02850 [Huiozyma naganishii CBS 8797]|uniref:glucan endo-1,3-beta-D-glucosidase n=1 Tax=Huiozyma naganishii (strain ATCC MYA-139 / BCRC 22969 / CBS 8797 / KCTC 17520 / NBRC 10181 / NCYC 3082 / Yp74L-3) TaxID=1071383 RepID=J7S259_HUIN7|nr:hypothetical protein KNAG_0A02850 [Kazachstania naganishii CBS 8797]CCK67974.1 hypothetical protein KNAG_0A02850 [Kazachstania naganishii CBS 8797]